MKNNLEQVYSDVMSIATEEEIKLVCEINGTNLKSLNSIIYSRVGYTTYNEWVESEGCY